MISSPARSVAPSPSGESDFEAVFRECYRPVLLFFFKRGYPSDEARDLAQETFLRAHSRWDSFRGDAKPLTWLMTIATNLLRNKWRDAAAGKRDGKEVSLADDSVIPASADRPLAAAIDDERRRLLRAAVEELPPRMRQCVLLRVYQDKSYRDIADVLDITAGTAKSQVSLAQARLRERQAEHYPEDLGAGSVS